VAAEPIAAADRDDRRRPIARFGASLRRRGARLERPLARDRCNRVDASGGSPRPDARSEAGADEFWTSRSWWRRAGKTSIAAWCATALGLVGTIVAARGLGPNDYGLVALAIAAATFVASFLDLTLEEGVVHHGFRAIASGDLGALRSLLRAAFLVDLGIGILLAALLVGFAGPIADLASGGRLDPSLIQLAALMTLATTVNGTTGSVLLLAGRPDLRALIMAATNLARLLALLAAVQLGGPAAVVGAYALAAAIGALVQGVTAWGVGWREWTGAKTTRSARAWIRPLTTFGIHSSLTSSVVSMERSLVLILLGAIAGPSAAGIFNVALLPVGVMALATEPIRLVLYPEQARLAARGDLRSLRRTMTWYSGVGLAVGIPCAIAGWFVLPWLIPMLFSDQFDDAVEPARILLPAAVCFLALGWSKTVPAAIGKPHVRTAVSALSAIIMLTLTAVLAPRYESNGAAVAYTAAAVSVSVIWCWWFFTGRALKGAPPRASVGQPRGPGSLPSPPDA
jgi:O-antigen/teichoic acid export membrane protein